MSTAEHKKDAPQHVTIAIVTVSTTRALENDKSGRWINAASRREGHQVVEHRVISDDAVIIAATVQEIIQKMAPQVILMTGGTGITPADVTIEAVTPLFIKELKAFGTLFAVVSLEQIGSAAILSRATAGVIGTTVVFCMPGSLNACRLACRKLIFPELGHLVKHVKE